MPAKKHHSTEFKAKVALEALRGLKTINEISSETGVHATQINTWKKQAREGLKEIFLQKVSGRFFSFGRARDGLTPES
ncbi:MAG: transposase [Cyanobacteriota bacterium]|jgi:transposase-like protein